MAANYWTSTQRKFWHFTPSRLASIRSALTSQHTAVVTQYPISDPKHVLIFFRDQLSRLSRRLQSRQQCLATTLVYIHRYLLTHPLQTVNPYLLLTTAFYLASKTEESPHNIRHVLSEARQLWPEFVHGDVSRIGEMEFSLISEMRSQLIVWHPYRTLIELKGPESDGGLGLTADEAALAWSIINDSYLTDLPLTCAPHILAIMAIFLAVALEPGIKSSANSTTTKTAPKPSNNAQPTFQLSPPTHIPQPPFTRLGSSSSSSSHSGLSTNITKILTSSQQQSQSKPPSPQMAKLTTFLANSSIDLGQIIDATQDLLSLYEAWESYGDKAVRENIARCVKGTGLDK
jgi:cyclin-C